MKVWAGVLPASMNFGKPIIDPQMSLEIKPPDYITNYRRSQEDS
jgi:hypothetical protein